MIATFRKVNERLGREETVQFEVAEDTLEVAVPVQILRGMDMSDSPSAYGKVRFRDKGHETYSRQRIFDFDGYTP